MMKKIFILLTVLFYSAISAQNFTIVLDAGHGGDDNGAVYNDVKESELMLQFTQTVAQALSEFDTNVKVIQTRADNSNVDINSRVDQINQANADLLVSFHMNNQDNSNVNGFELYYPNNHDQEKSKQYAEIIGSALPQFQFTDRGVQDAGFAVLKNANCPAVMVELGFISNESDRNSMQNNLTGIAYAVAKNLLAISYEQ